MLMTANKKSTSRLIDEMDRDMSISTDPENAWEHQNSGQPQEKIGKSYYELQSEEDRAQRERRWQEEFSAAGSESFGG